METNPHSKQFRSWLMQQRGKIDGISDDSTRQKILTILISDEPITLVEMVYAAHVLGWDINCLLRSNRTNPGVILTLPEIPTKIRRTKI